MKERIDQQEAITAALFDFTTRPFADASLHFFATLGYKSDRRLPLHTPGDFFKMFDTEKALTPKDRNLFSGISAMEFLFQLTDQELASHTQGDLFEDKTAVDGMLIHSYLFFAVELSEPHPNRGHIAALARAINKPLHMPALVLFKHGDSISLAIIHRRLHKRVPGRDVLE